MAGNAVLDGKSFELRLSPKAFKGCDSYKVWGGTYALVKVLVRVMVRDYLVLAISAAAFGSQGRVGWQFLRGVQVLDSILWHDNVRKVVYVVVHPR